jgi:hypothetical protein
MRLARALGVTLDYLAGMYEEDEEEDELAFTSVEELSVVSTR